MSLLTQKPLRSITVKELCEQAGLNRGTFYAHYADTPEQAVEMVTSLIDHDLGRGN